jgi:RNA polymerase sigma factor (sigma-70 family)
MEAIARGQMAQDKGKNISNTITTYGKRLFGFIRSKVNTNEDAEDLLQDVWVRFSQLTNLDELESVSGWLYQVARNRVTDFYRKQKTQSLEENNYEDEDGELSFKEILLADDTHHPELKQFKNIFWDQLLQALDELPANQREVFVRHELEDESLQQIADSKGENIKTIISRKGYAVKHLRERLDNLYNEFINT